MLLRRLAASCLLLTAGLAAAAATTAARADTILYSNTTTFSGFGFANGGAALQGANTITTMVADDIQVGPGLGGLTVDGFTFSVANFNAAAVTARARVRFYAADGAGTGPGTYLTGFSFGPIAFAASSVQLFGAATPGAFVVPVSGLFWAAITFDNADGTTGATAAQLNNLGQGIFNPPTVGSSADAFFQTSAAGSFLGNNPAGGFFFFGGSPVANFGWQFRTSAVPEPSPMLLGSGLVVLGGLVRFARSRLRIAA